MNDLNNTHLREKIEREKNVVVVVRVGKVNDVSVSVADFNVEA